MRGLYSVVMLLVLTMLAPRSLAAQDKGSVDFVSGFSLAQGASITNSFSSGMNLAGRVAVNVVPGFQAVGEVGRIANVLPPLTSAIFSLSPFDVRASATYGEGGVRLFAAPRSAVNPYVESTMGVAHVNLRVGGIGATERDLINLGLAFVSRTSPLASIGGGVMLRSGPMTFDMGYRYKKIFAKDFVDTLLGGGQSLKSQQVTFGVGVRF